MVQYITYKEQKYPVRVSYLALKKLKATTGKALADVANDDFEVYEKLFYYAMVSGANAVDEKLKFEETDMEDILDECFMEFMELIPLFFPKKVDLETGKEMSIEKK